MNISLTKPSTAEAKLTVRQQQILELIKNAILITGAPPTRAEIATELGFKSANAAEEHLKALAKKGAIELISGTSRGIRVRHASTGQVQPGQSEQPILSSSGFSKFMLPLVGRVAAGYPIFAQEHIEKTYQVDSNLFSQKPDYLLKVCGMSMRGAGILDGDLLAVKQIKEAKNGQIVIARLGEDEVTVKRFKKTDHGIELIPENDDFPTIYIADGQSFSLEGLAVGLIRNSIFK